MSHSLSRSGGYSPNVTVAEEILDYSWRVPPPPHGSPRPYGEPSWRWTSPLQIRREPLVPMLPRQFQYSSPNATLAEEIPDYSWRVPQPPPGSPRPYGEPSWEWPTPYTTRPPFVQMLPRKFEFSDSSHYGSLLKSLSEPSLRSPTGSSRVTPQNPPLFMHPRRLDFSATSQSSPYRFVPPRYGSPPPVMDETSDDSWPVPQTPTGTPRRSGEPSWEWTSPLRTIESPLVPMPPRYFERSDVSSYNNSLPSAFSEPSLQTPIGSAVSTPRVPVILTPRQLNLSSPILRGPYRFTTPVVEWNLPDAKELMITQMFNQKILDDMAKEEELMPSDEVLKKNLANELLDLRVKLALTLELCKRLTIARAKLQSIYITKERLYRNLVQSYRELHQLVEKVADELGPEFEDPKYIMARIQRESAAVQQHVQVWLQRADNIQTGFQDLVEFVKHWNRQHDLTIIPMENRLSAAHDTLFVYKITLNQERNKKDELRFHIINEKAIAQEYEDQCKMEHLAWLRLKDSIKKIKKQLNYVRNIVGVPPDPPSPPSPDIHPLQGEVAELMSRLVEEIKVNKELTEYTIKVPPRHIMNILKRYLRAESYRKALTWQKKYLLLALRNCENDHEPNIIQFEKRRFNAKGLWRAATYVIIAIHRTQNLLMNRSTTHKTAVNALQQAYVNAEA